MNKIERVRSITTGMKMFDLTSKDSDYITVTEWENCHDENGEAIKPPDNIDCMTAFISGDYL